MTLVGLFLFISIAMWLDAVERCQCQNGTVLYAELVGLPNNKRTGYKQYGILIRTDHKKYYLKYAGPGVEQRAIIESQAQIEADWIILYGRPTSPVDAKKFLNSQGFTNKAMKPTDAINFLRKWPGVIERDPNQTEILTANSYTNYYNVRFLRTSLSCFDLDLKREQYFSTDFLNVAEFSKVNMTVSYVTTGCVGNRSDCTREVTMYATFVESTQEYDEFFFPNKNDPKTKAFLLTTDKIGRKEYDSPYLFDVRKDKRMAVGFEVKGMCFRVLHIDFTTKRCKRQVQNLANYHSVFAPSRGSLASDGYCVRNAEPQGANGLRWFCNEEGVATYGKGCMCVKGYLALHNGCIKKVQRARIILLAVLIPLSVLIVTIIFLAKLRQRRIAKILRKRPSAKFKKKKAYKPLWSRILRMGRGNKEKLVGQQAEGNLAPFLPAAHGLDDIDLYEVPRSTLTFCDLLGHGQFGPVYSTEAQMTGTSTKLNVAAEIFKESPAAESPGTSVSPLGILSLARLCRRITHPLSCSIDNESAEDDQEDDFYAQLELLKQLGRHENITQLLGYCTEQGPPCFVLEFMQNGDLHTFVREHCKEDDEGRDMSTLRFQDLLGFALMTARAMQFIGEKRIVHRDLAPSNIHLDHNKTCKLGGFGLARYLEEDNAFLEKPKWVGKLPTKWMAPECMEEKENYRCTMKSDVWSFGILLWQIFSCGDNPYGDQDQQEIFQSLADGYRLESPENCPDEMYQVMLGCWNDDAQVRPLFSVIEGTFSDEGMWRNAVAVLDSRLMHTLHNVKESSS